MTQREILEELKKFPAREHLTIIESVLHLIYEDIQQIEQPLAQTEKKQRLAAAAKALLPDYSAGGELTAFTALDHEDIHAQG